MPLPARPADLTLDLPAEPERAALAGRAAAVAVTNTSDPHVHDDVRLTVEEFAHVLAVVAAPLARLRLRVWVDATTVVVEGRVAVARPGSAPSLSALSSILLDTLTRAHVLETEGDELVFRLSTLAAGTGPPGAPGSSPVTGPD
ncbi:hypothetical protein [Salsipaludibacter albus]|uniref:hypothetical protein n=1 Tax=Salsipaludibacter albus TaxID=2849650 RepID=UPI001EE400DA|nr:hypothetical protein [Salsipaludibacter albus]MBY5161345.1 hypothetical protein [Salsipaludibacter albus]